MKIISSRNISYAEMLKMIEDLVERGVELESIELRVLDYLRRFNKCKRGDELVKELEKKGFSEVTAVMIANISPKDVETLKILLSFESKNYGEEFLSEVLQIINEYCGK